MTKPEVTILRKGLDDQAVIESEYDFSADIAKVQVELIFFRDQCLPAFLDGDVDESQGEAHAQWVQKKIHNVALLVSCRIGKRQPIVCPIFCPSAL